jgi:signal transduction histidine kinase
MDTDFERICSNLPLGIIKISHAENGSQITYKNYFADKFIHSDGKFIDGVAPLIRKESGQVILQQDKNMFEVKLLDSSEGALIFSLDIIPDKFRDNYEELYQINEQLNDTVRNLEMKNEHIEHLYQKIINSEKELKDANNEKDKFLSIIAHDLRTPIQGFMGLTKVLTDEHGHLSEEEFETIAKQLADSSKNLNNLLENLLNWSRLQRDKLPFNPTMVNVSQMISINIDLLKYNFSLKEQKICMEIPRELNCYADINMFNTVVRNLLSNANKFTPEKGQIEITAEKREKFAEISIKDNGIGITNDIFLKLFNFDQRVVRKGTADEHGTGLGLILCKQLVERNGGGITVKSEPGTGSEFTFTLPLKSSVKREV